MPMKVFSAHPTGTALVLGACFAVFASAAAASDLDEIPVAPATPGGLTPAPAAVPAVAPSAMPAPIVVEIAPGAPVRDVDAVRAAIARELGRPALPPTSPAAASADAQLSIALDAQGRLVLTYRSADREEVVRTVAIPRNRLVAAALVSLLAGNVARDQTVGLVNPTPASPPEVPAAPTVVVVPTMVILGTPAVDLETPRGAEALPDRARPAARSSANDRHAGILGIAAGVGGGAALPGGGTYWGPTISLAGRWPAFSLGIETQYMRSSYFSLLGVSARGLAHVRAGWFDFGFGGGLGALVDVRRGDTLALVRAIARAEIAFAPRLDVYAQLDVGGGIDFRNSLGSGFLVQGFVGVQARLL